MNHLYSGGSNEVVIRAYQIEMLKMTARQKKFKRIFRRESFGIVQDPGPVVFRESFSLSIRIFQLFASPQAWQHTSLLQVHKDLSSPAAAAVDSDIIYIIRAGELMQNTHSLFNQAKQVNAKAVPGAVSNKVLHHCQHATEMHHLLIRRICRPAITVNRALFFSHDLKLLAVHTKYQPPVQETGPGSRHTCLSGLSETGYGSWTGGREVPVHPSPQDGPAAGADIEALG